MVEVAALLPEGATLVVGNSMPIRDVDAFVRGDRDEYGSSAIAARMASMGWFRPRWEPLPSRTALSSF